MKAAILYATSNPGKIREIGRLFGFHGLEVHALADFLPGVTLDPEENGSSLGDNALIKARAYAEAVSAAPSMRGRSFVVMSDDTGIFIDGLHGEPGIRVRRWVGRKMNDEEIIEHCLRSMSGISGEDRAATFRTVLCMLPVSADGKVGEAVTAEGELRGHILEAASASRRSSAASTTTANAPSRRPYRSSGGWWGGET
ncbi:non-canonical purine NTP pyrophosphatase [Patescibacteria group bacterium]|nr:non-canonical purine NTP pyrophosphatase [Patescibacteria group bacterium]